MRISSVFFGFLAASILAAASAVGAPDCQLSLVSFSLYERIGEFGKEKNVDVSSTLNFNLCVYGTPLIQIGRDTRSPFKTAAVDFFSTLFKADLEHFQRFFQPSDMIQYDALVAQRKTIITDEKGFTLGTLLLRDALEKGDEAYFSVEIKGRDKVIPFVLRMRSLPDKSIKAVFNTKDDLIGDIYSSAAPGEFARTERKKFSHKLILGTYPGSTTPMASYDFNVLRPGDRGFTAVTDFFKKILSLLKANQTEEFLSLVEDRKAWEKQWAWEKSSGVSGGPASAATAYERLQPVGALDLDSVIILYFADQQHTNVNQVFRFQKNGNSFLFLRERVGDTMGKLYNHPQLKKAVLELEPFKSLKISSP